MCLNDVQAQRSKVLWHCLHRKVAGENEATVRVEWLRLASFLADCCLSSHKPTNGAPVVSPQFRLKPWTDNLAVESILNWWRLSRPFAPGLHGIKIGCRRWDLNPRPSGYEPDELPDCSTLHTVKIRGVIVTVPRPALYGRMLSICNSTPSCNLFLTV
jgi:hypothetical protein